MFETKLVNLVMGIRNFLFTKDGTVDDYNIRINKIWFWKKKKFYLIVMHMLIFQNAAQFEGYMVSIIVF